MYPLPAVSDIQVASSFNYTGNPIIKYSYERAPLSKLIRCRHSFIPQNYTQKFSLASKPVCFGSVARYTDPPIVTAHLRETTCRPLEVDNRICLEIFPELYGSRFLGLLLSRAAENAAWKGNPWLLQSRILLITDKKMHVNGIKQMREETHCVISLPALWVDPETRALISAAAEEVCGWGGRSTTDLRTLHQKKKYSKSSNSQQQFMNTCPCTSCLIRKSNHK